MLSFVGHEIHKYLSWLAIWFTCVAFFKSTL